MIPTCENEAEILLLFSVVIIIIRIIIKYDSVIYWDCTRFPCPTTEHKVKNEREVIQYTLSFLLDCYEKEVQLFATLCISLLASIIQFTEIFLFCLCGRVFPSDYGENLVLAPLPNQVPEGSSIPESDIPALDLMDDSDFVEHPSREKFLPKCRSNNR